jgi:cytochrome c553
MKTISKITLLAAALILPVSLAHADGASDYKSKCASCHGADGSGNTKMGKKSGARDYRDAKIQASFSDAEAIKAIKDGVTEDGRKKMKAYGDKFSEAEMKELVKVIRAFKK